MVKVIMKIATVVVSIMVIVFFGAFTFGVLWKINKVAYHDNELLGLVLLFLIFSVASVLGWTYYGWLYKMIGKIFPWLNRKG